MLKNYAAILMMFIAYTILLGHTIIPHHHIDHDHQHLVEHHHDSDDDSRDFKHFFLHFSHSDQNPSLVTHYCTISIFSKQQLPMVALLTDNFSLEKFYIFPLRYKPPKEHIIYFSPHFLSSGLRAPPVS